MEALPTPVAQPQHYRISQHHNPRPYIGGEGSGPVELTKEPSHSDNNTSNEDRRGSELRAQLDCNLTSLCDHIQLEGFNNGAFSDVIVHAMDSVYHLHRLILSRSSYFRNMLQGPWKEANAPVLTLHVDDTNVDGEAMSIALAYLYGHHPKLNENNAFRVLAVASFLDLQDLCTICTDFIISELWTSNFLAYQVFAENQDYGIHGERVRNACWGYLCQSGARELKEVLPKLSPQTLHALLTSDELWVPSEEKRFELALFILLAKGTLCKTGHHEQGSSNSDVVTSTYSDLSKEKGNHLVDGCPEDMLEPEGFRKLKDEVESHYTAHNILVELVDCVVDSHSDVANCKQQVQKSACSQSNLESRYQSNTERTSASNKVYADEVSTSCSYLNMPIGVGMNGSMDNGVIMEGPSDEDSSYQLNNCWPPDDQMQCMSMNSSCNMLIPNEWGRCDMQPLSWGGRIVGRSEVKTCLKRQCGVSREDYDAFVNIFEGGSLLYCNMSFEALLNVRKRLEEIGFPCKAVNDGLWLQMLLSQRVQEIGTDTCKNCWLRSMACTCRQPFGYSRGVTASGYYTQEHDHNNLSNDLGHVYVTNSAQGERNGLFRPVRVHVRGPNDGLAGIGRGTTFVPAAAWPPTRYVFSRVPFGMGNRHSQQSLGNDDPENRGDNNGDFAGDGLTALVGLSQGANNASSILGEQTEREYETDQQRRLAGSSVSGPSTSGVPVQMMESSEHAIGIEWENATSSISLDLKTPLSHFPPFRFAVEFQDVHRLSDGQVKHSPEVFYAGSFWKVSVHAFSDEDPQGRRTLGLFLHRRKAEISDPLRKVHMYVDSREKVTARYQLICPSKREVMVFGSFKQTGTLLPKAPKGWGWRTALLFDELGDLLQDGALRIAAVVQLI
ncbi:BTB domain-containing [Olea europaea subsp. europaea]|uniref:BTB domain-containing n=2 Tax=Olea europaea subsp. europaea TaxID=158383 RepID=A0A8S0U3H6_OLEEU|nr:BTB domain-containing [Olea europaea subsp. europaea]